MFRSVIAIVALALILDLATATRNRYVPSTDELQSARARLKPTSCKSVGSSVNRCVNSRSNECCSRECDANSACKCSGLGERCANDADCCQRSVGANTVQVPCLNRICTLAEGGQ